MDYCIIGSGPTGLTIAWILTQLGNKVIIIDKESVIGGCHRVRRVNKFFTEHGPRIYSTVYLNTIKLLDDMNLNFNDYFVPYNFSITNIGNISISNMKIRELLLFSYEFLKMSINYKFSQSISCLEFMKKHNFSDITIDFIDRICRITDGAGANKYTLFELLQLLNQHFFYSILQPKYPNDRGLIKDIKYVLEKNNVKFKLNIEINKIINNNNTIDYIVGTKNNKLINIKAKNYIFAIPPIELIKILNNSNNYIKNSFGEYNQLEKWVYKNNYNIYISITFHWNKKLKLPTYWGVPLSDWGIAFIVLTDYMDFENCYSKTVISTCITKPNNKSQYINKTINECNENELINETLRQVRIAFPDLINPTRSIISPGDYKKNQKWNSKDSAYISTNDMINGYPIKFRSILFDNLYSCGTHNGYSKYYFTSMESAVTNGFAICHILDKRAKKYKIQEPLSITLILRIIYIIIVIILIIIILKIKLII